MNIFAWLISDFSEVQSVGSNLSIKACIQFICPTNNHMILSFKQVFDTFLKYSRFIVFMEGDDKNQFNKNECINIYSIMYSRPKVFLFF